MSWSQATLLPQPGATYRTIIGAGEILVAGGHVYSDPGSRWVVHISQDGLQWTDSRIDVLGQLHVAHWTGDEIILAGEAGEIVQSPDGVNWSHEALGTTYDIIRMAVRVLAVISNGRLAFKTDGGPWVIIEEIDPEAFYIRDVVWDGAQFVALGVQVASLFLRTVGPGVRLQRVQNPATNFCLVPRWVISCAG